VPIAQVGSAHLGSTGVWSARGRLPSICAKISRCAPI
jgi:hypothetical protein